MLCRAVRSGGGRLAVVLLLLGWGVSPAAALDAESYVHSAEALFFPLAGGKPVSFRLKPQLRRAQGKISVICREAEIPLGETGAVLSVPSLRLDFGEEAGGEVSFTGTLPGWIGLRLAAHDGLRVAVGHAVLTGAVDSQSGRVVRAAFAAERLAAAEGPVLQMGSFRYEMELAPVKGETQEGQEGGLAQILRVAMEDVRIGALAFRQGRYAGTSLYETAEAFGLAQGEGGRAAFPPEPGDSEDGGLMLTGLRLRFADSAFALAADELRLKVGLEPSPEGEGLELDAAIGFSGVKSDWPDFTMESGRIHLGLGAVKAETMRALLAGKPVVGSLFDHGALDLVGERIRLGQSSLGRTHLVFSAKDLEEESGSGTLSFRASGLQGAGLQGAGKNGAPSGEEVGVALDLGIEDLPASLFRPGRGPAYDGDSLLTLLDRGRTALAVSAFSLDAGRGRIAGSGRLAFDADAGFGATGEIDATVRDYDALAAGLLGLAPEGSLSRWQRAAALIRNVGVKPPAGSGLGYALRIESDGARSVNGKELDSLLARIGE